MGDPGRAEATLSRALGEVFDGPLVRQLLAHRARLRREQLGDKAGAAVDLKKLHDLSPNDQAVMDDLSGLLTELGDYRGMVQLYEDQILRGKDMGARSELARKVARMWEEQLADPREAADAWRRVLRMKAGDTEATAGLERAKSNMLKRPEPGGEREAYAPPQLQTTPPPAGAPPPDRATDPAPPASMPPARESVATQKASPLSASLRAALAGEADDDVTVDAPPDYRPDRPRRPEGLFFRSSSREDATLSAPHTQPEDARPTLPADERDLAIIEQTFAPGSGRDELMHTTEGPALDFEATLARPSKTAEPPPPADTGKHATLEAHTDEEEDELAEDVLIADDLAEVDLEEEGAPETQPANEGADALEEDATEDEQPPKRSVPPPLPR